MTTRVLLLGATGAVGRACLDALAADPEVTITLAGRDPAAHRALRTPGVRVAEQRLDLAALSTDGARLLDLAKRADVVVNCAGPSHRLSRSVAAVVMLCGAAYVDPGLNRATMERIRRHMPHDAVAVVQTGVQPGLSGLAVRGLAEFLGGADRVRAWCGGLQPLTAAAVAEYLAEAADGRSAVLRDHSPIRLRPSEVGDPPRAIFPPTARGHAHLDDEIVAVAERFAIPDLEWFNVTDHPAIERALGRLDEDASAAVERIRAAAHLDLFGRDPYFTLFARADRGDEHAAYLLSARDSYAVTGTITAWAARTATTAPPGLHPLWSLPRAAELTARLRLVPGLRITLEAGEPDHDRGVL
ncbi:saccharopine dehydrogenase NADP-binding domain-containing protein [Nocardia takedensis]